MVGPRNLPLNRSGTMSLRNSPSSSTIARVDLTVLAIGLSLSLAGCSIPFGAGAAPTSTSNLTGPVVSTGKKVNTSTGSYQTITVDKESAVYKYDPSKFNMKMMAERGYAEETGRDGQQFAASYLVEQYLDSTALEGDMNGFRSWYKTTGSNLIDPRISTKADVLAPYFLVLGNYGKQKNFPAFVHDGQPRVSSVDLKLVEAGPYFMDDDSKLPGISYGFQFKADYRVSDAAAAAWAGLKTGMSGEKFLKSNMAKPSLKDSAGENVFRVTGTVYAVAQPDNAGTWQIVGFENREVKGDTSDFTEKNFESKWVSSKP